MDLPKIPYPPSENLYKFMALLGMALVIAGPVYWGVFTVKLSELETNCLRASVTETNAAEVHAMMNQAFRLHAKLIDAKKEPSYEEVRQDLKDARVLDNEAAAIYSKHTEAINETFLANRQYHRLLNYSKGVNFLCVFGVIVGIALMSVGFCFWYMRCQRYEDAHIRRLAADSSSNAA